MTKINPVEAAQAAVKAAKEQLQAAKAAEKAAKEIERKARQAQEAEAFKAFRERMYRELEIEQNPKRELLFSKAWDLGHAYGYSEVEHYLHDLVDLIR